MLLYILTYSLLITAAYAGSTKLYFTSALNVTWDAALPIGNGKLAAMVFGIPINERIQFNEDTLWSGKPHDYAHKDAFTHLAEIRNLVFNGKSGDALSIGNKYFMGDPIGQTKYVPF